MFNWRKSCLWLSVCSCATELARRRTDTELDIGRRGESLVGGGSNGCWWVVAIQFDRNISGEQEQN